MWPHGSSRERGGACAEAARQRACVCKPPGRRLMCAIPHLLRGGHTLQTFLPTCPRAPRRTFARTYLGRYGRQALVMRPAQVFQGATVGVVSSRGRVRERTKFRKPPRGGCTLLARARAGGRRWTGELMRASKKRSKYGRRSPPCRRRLVVACARGGEPDTWRGDGEATLLVD